VRLHVRAPTNRCLFAEERCNPLILSRSLFGLYSYSFITSALFFGTLALAACRGSRANESAAATPESPGMAEHRGMATSLRELIQEAEQKNRRSRPLSRVASFSKCSEASLLSAETQLSVQQFSVGSPRPFAGYQHKRFAYIGFGDRRTFLTR